jgi:hypothetical protein
MRTCRTLNKREEKTHKLLVTGRGPDDQFFISVSLNARRILYFCQSLIRSWESFRLGFHCCVVTASSSSCRPVEDKQLCLQCLMNLLSPQLVVIQQYTAAGKVSWRGSIGIGSLGCHLRSALWKLPLPVPSMPSKAEG